MLFADRLTFDSPRRTRDGYMAVRAKAARAGIYEYLGREVDPQGAKFGANDTVKVYRPEAEVFAKDSVASFLMKPITNDHPAQAVTADNWKTHAKGVIGAALREGDFLAFDLVLMDADMIADVESGKRELSNGYSSELEFVDGKTDAGEEYQVIQRSIRGNHVAVVDKGRAGPFCRIGDAAPCDALPHELIVDGQTYSASPTSDKNAPARRETSNFDGGSPVATKTIMFDGLPVEVTDAAEAVIRKLEGQAKVLTDGKAKAETDLAEAVTASSTKDAEIVTLKKQIEDAKVTPAQLRDAAKAYQGIVDKAKALGVTVTDEMDQDAIMKAVVTAKVGDAAKDWNDVQVSASFATLSNDAKSIDPVRKVIAAGAVQIGDTASIRDSARSARYAAGN